VSELPVPAGVRITQLSVARTARVATSGAAPAAARELWYILHGYAMLAPAFLGDASVLDDGTRMLVAPEALSRFYDGGQAERMQHKEIPVGASWMTREDREAEIADANAYLDAVHAMVAGEFTAAGVPLPPVTVLGFSQGGATAARWIASGRAPATRFILWGSSMAHDVDITSVGAPLRNVETIIVAGTRDIFATPKAVEREMSRLTAAGLRFGHLSFDGGHRLDDDTLRAIAGIDAKADATGAD
jgi:predicted esterase